MIRSMTGYGRAEKPIDGREITVEMRAVNNRYLDLNVKLPRVYGFAEDAVKSLIKANVNRQAGSVHHRQRDGRHQPADLAQ